MKLNPFPTKEERQARTPYHAIDIGGPPVHVCAYGPNCLPAVGYVEVWTKTPDGVEILIDLPICTKHYQDQFGPVSIGYKVEK